MNTQSADTRRCRLWVVHFSNHMKFKLSPKWKHRVALAARTALGLLAVSTLAHATVFDSAGNYLYSGFTGPLAKGLATGVLVLSAYGLKHSEGRAHNACMMGAIASGGILAAPILVNEFQSIMSGMIWLPSLL